MQHHPAMLTKGDASQVKARWFLLRSVPLHVIPGRQKPNCPPTPPFDNLVATPRFFHLPALTPSPHWKRWSATVAISLYVKPTGAPNQIPPFLQLDLEFKHAWMLIYSKRPQPAHDFWRLQVPWSQSVPTFTSMYLKKLSAHNPCPSLAAPTATSSKGRSNLTLLLAGDTYQWAPTEPELAGWDWGLSSFSQSPAAALSAWAKQSERITAVQILFLRKRIYDFVAQDDSMSSRKSMFGPGLTQQGLVRPLTQSCEGSTPACSRHVEMRYLVKHSQVMSSRHRPRHALVSVPLETPLPISPFLVGFLSRLWLAPAGIIGIRLYMCLSRSETYLVMRNHYNTSQHTISCNCFKHHSITLPRSSAPTPALASA